MLLVVALAALGAALDSGKPGATTTPPTVAAVKAAPKVADFKVTAKVTEKTCYGQAGCSVTWHPVVTYTGPAIADGQTWVVSYTVSGVESGTKAGSIVMGSTGPAKQSDKHARIAREDSTITVKVTGVERS